jgi:hypothetical protein
MEQLEEDFGIALKLDSAFDQSLSHQLAIRLRMGEEGEPR